MSYSFSRELISLVELRSNQEISCFIIEEKKAVRIFLICRPAASRNVTTWIHAFRVVTSPITQKYSIMGWLILSIRLSLAALQVVQLSVLFPSQNTVMLYCANSSRVVPYTTKRNGKHIP